MNWESIMTEIILGIVGIVISGLGALVTYWISTKIKDENKKEILNSLHEVVKDSVLETYQVYVEELKEKGTFNADAQKIALSHAIELIKVNLPEKVKEWLKSNVKDVTAYLKSMIETQIALLKK